MAKDKEFRHGDPEVVEYLPDPAGESYCTKEQIRRSENMAEQVIQAKSRGEHERHDALLERWKSYPGYGTNTNVVDMVYGVEVTPWGTTTINSNVAEIGTGKGKPGAPRDPKVAKRRESVRELRDEGLEAGEIAARLKVGVSIVYADLKRIPPKS